MPDMDTELDTLCASVAALARTVDEMRDRHRGDPASIVTDLEVLCAELISRSDEVACVGVVRGAACWAFLESEQRIRAVIGKHRGVGEGGESVIAGSNVAHDQEKRPVHREQPTSSPAPSDALVEKAGRMIYDGLWAGENAIQIARAILSLAMKDVDLEVFFAALTPPADGGGA